MIVDLAAVRKESVRDRVLQTDPHVIVTISAWHLADRTWWVEPMMTSRVGQPLPPAFDVLGRSCIAYGQGLVISALGRRPARQRARVRRAKTGRRA